MKQVFLIAAFLILGVHLTCAQDKVIRWANDSLVILNFDTVMRQTGNKLEGTLELKRSRKKVVYEIKNGFIQSRYTFSLDGLKTEEMHFKNGEPDGKYKLWDDYKGTLITEGYYKNGLKDSNWVFYHYNGKKQLEGRLLADSSSLIDGFEYERASVHEGGEIWIERILTTGHSPFDGDWMVYDEEGNKIQTLRFRKGVLVGFFFPKSY
ncbi:MAG: hypothetical protein JNM21_05870 [Taibaiella sp.]|nr:hypothetical protein [Taibaiella sp.]